MRPDPIVPTAAPENGRRLLRRPADIPVRVGSSSLPAAQARITDISRLGCRLEIGCRFGPRATLSVAVPGLGMLAAVVVWSTFGAAGLEFRRPLHQAVLDWLLAGNGVSVIA